VAALATAAAPLHDHEAAGPAEAPIDGSTVVLRGREGEERGEGETRWPVAAAAAGVAAKLAIGCGAKPGRGELVRRRTEEAGVSCRARALSQREDSSAVLGRQGSGVALPLTRGPAE